MRFDRYESEAAPYAWEMEHDNLLRYVAMYRGRLRADLLPIAHDPLGNLLCIATGGEGAGRIYFWDHEREADGGEIRLLAESLPAFLANLAE